MSDQDYNAIRRTPLIEFANLPVKTRQRYLKKCPDFVRVALLKITNGS